MSTSEPDKNPSSFQGVDLRTASAVGSAGLPAGLPDPEILARMANEFFTALPPAEAAVPVALPAATTEPVANRAGLASVPAATPPAEERFRALPATLSSTSASPQVPAVPGGILSGISDPLSTADFTRPGTFSFLDDARPLFAFSNSTWPVALPAQTIKIPAESELLALADPFPAFSLPPFPELRPDSAVPQVPGAPLQPNLSDILPGYSFLNEVRQLVPAGTTAATEPSKTPSDAPAALALSSQPFDVLAIRRDFPILEERVNGKPLIWLDNAATTQKPKSVIGRLSHFYSHENSNIHRAAHELAARATDAYEAAREKVRRFLNASSTKEILFVRGATEGINLVAQSWGRQNIRKDDEIVITWLEHHANIVPWQMLCAEAGARLRVAPVDDSGQVLLDEYQKLLGPKTRLVSFTQVSNALGTVTPAREMIEMAHRYGAKVLLDGAQAVSHMHVDVQAYDCDFYVFSGHKVFAPTGIGVVFGKLDILEQTQPWQGGGNMILDVTFEKTTYQPAPGRFEAGTGNIADAVGLGAAIDYLERIGMVNVSRYEHDLLAYATDGLQRIPGLRLIGTAREKAGVLSFVLDGFRTEDVGTALNRQGIAVRAGHHCAQPILRRFGVESTVRPSLALYNTCEDIDALIAAIWNLKQGHTSL
ncbi:MAG TPA: family 2A encapsulin nanocompartment cargo protein cysteine desulfurase [Candidatus Saccharimonadales bacterium]|nr:family 2A encapsulin nanocompartment cargo protein cysteine desulfurase [Candidatus Saccharimonadales bacterium]